MKRAIIFAGGVTLLALFFGACSTPQFQTIKILESPSREVALQAMPEAYGGKGYDHPITLTSQQMERVLKGVRIERGLVSSTRYPAFSETEIQLFAPHLVKALQKATKEEMVTFYETAELGDTHQLTTSGGIFVAGGNLHVILSNFSVKTPLWQDNEQYEASFRNRPLEQMEPQPGRLVYEPRQYMVESPEGEIGSRLKGKPWQVAIQYRKILGMDK